MMNTPLPVSQQILELPPDFSGEVSNRESWRNAAEIGHCRACRAAAALVLPLEERNKELERALHDLASAMKLTAKGLGGFREGSQAELAYKNAVVALNP